MTCHEKNHAAGPEGSQPNGVRTPLFRVVAEIGLTDTNGYARRLIRGGGVMVNGLLVKDDNCPIMAGDIITIRKNGELKDFRVTSELVQKSPLLTPAGGEEERCGTRRKPWLMPPRMKPGQPILNGHDLADLQAFIIKCRVRGDTDVAHTAWRQYSTWRAFFWHVRKLGFPALYRGQ